jgi:hypothetical protein
MTSVRRIDLGQVPDLNEAIEALCINMKASGFHLASTFVFQTQLVLIFQT